MAKPIPHVIMPLTDDVDFTHAIPIHLAPAPGTPNVEDVVDARVAPLEARVLALEAQILGK